MDNGTMEPAAILGAFGPKPEWAVAVIVAELHEDVSDPQTDYFSTRRTVRVRLAWSSHRRDIFGELRKAAATMEETAHLGPGRDVYAVRVVLTADARALGHYKGERSPLFRGDPIPEFTTRADAEAYVAAQPAPEDATLDGVLLQQAWQITRESIEHREKYSMGAGYYLKADHRYSSGWVVRKEWAQ